MNAAEKFLHLQAETSRNLINFLGVELDLCHSMIELAKSTGNATHRASLLATVGNAIHSVRHFEGRVKDEEIRASINQRLARIEAMTKEIGS